MNDPKDMDRGAIRMEVAAAKARALRALVDLVFASLDPLEHYAAARTFDVELAQLDKTIEAFAVMLKAASDEHADLLAVAARMEDMMTPFGELWEMVSHRAPALLPEFR